MQPTHLRRAVLTATTAAALALSAEAQLAVFQGAEGAAGSVYVLDALGAAPPTLVSTLQGITLIPIECAGRTAINSFSNVRARHWADVPGAARLALPNARGSLYAYRRETASAELYGYFVVDSAGHVRRLIESATSSPGLSPFADRVAVAPDGGAILLATRSFAGGDLLEISIATGVVTVRTGNLPPQNFEGGGIALHDAWGAAVGTSSLLRFERTAGAQAHVAPIGNAAPHFIARELVSTFNGLYCAGFAGGESNDTYPIVFGRTGAARRVGDSGYETAGVGLAPDAVHGPWLTVSEDGQWCAWRTMNGHYWGYEAMLAAVPWQSAASSALHLTQPALFDDYIDEIGDFFFNAAGRFILAAGDRSANVNGLEKSDLYAVTLSGATGGTLPTVENLTGTSGETNAPFFYYGELVVERAFATPDGQSLYVVAQDEGERSMFAIQADNPVPLVLEDEFTTLDYFDVAGGQMILAATYSEEPEETGLSKVEAGVSTALEELHEYGTTRLFARGVSRADGQTLYVLASAAGEQLWRSSPGAEPVRMSPRELMLGPTLAFTPAGDAACTVETGGTPFYVVWPAVGALRRVKGPAGAGFLLPGS